MNLAVAYNPNSNIFVRVWDHAALGLKKDIGNREQTPPNLIEKAGNGILYIANLVPRSVKALCKSFQDPRVVTVALTAIALLATSFAFYPVPTALWTKAACHAAARLIHQIPLWAVKFSAYIATCAGIVGAGLRAGGRFNNAALMKEFYHLPQNFPHNPARLYASEIAQFSTTT